MVLQTVKIFINSIIAIHDGGAAFLVRLANSNPTLVKPIMDMGTDIIGFPFINTVLYAEKAVSTCTYHPNGIRECNPQRASYYGNMNYLDYIKNANNEILKIMLLEQKAGYNNIEEIVQVKGVDIIALSPSDLSLDMVFYGHMNKVEIRDMISQAAEICKKYDMPFVTLPSTEKKSIETWVNIGADMLCTRYNLYHLCY